MDKVRFILSTIQPMADYTFPYLASVIGVHDAQTGQHVGSGLRCSIRGRRAIATALHVIDSAKGYHGGFAISIGYGAPPYLVHGPVHLDRASDVALYYLPDDFPNNTPDVSFWPESNIDLTNDRLSTDYLFVHGFPAARSQFFRMAEGVASKSLPYGVMQRLDGLPSNLSSSQFAMDFDPANMKSPLGNSGADLFVDPHGLSGSPVWRIGISGGTAADWIPQRSRLVGFVTQWRPAQKLLVASMASRLLAVAQ
jgi:hypothetical protein